MRNMKQFVHNNFQLLFFFHSFCIRLLSITYTYCRIIVCAFALAPTPARTHHTLRSSLPCRYFLFCWNNKKKLALLRRFHIDKFTSSSWWARASVSVSLCVCVSIWTVINTVLYCFFCLSVCCCYLLSLAFSLSPSLTQSRPFFVAAIYWCSYIWQSCYFVPMNMYTL